MRKIVSISIAISLLLVAAPALAAGGGEGFPWADWAVSIVNLFIFIGIIVYFGRDSIREHFESRRKDLVENLDAAKRLREEAEEKLAEYKERLDALEDERQALLDQYHEQGEAEKARIIADAKKQVEKLHRDATLVIQQETRQAIMQLEQQAVDLAVGLASEKLEEKIDDDVDGKIVDRFVDDVRKIEAA